VKPPRPVVEQEEVDPSTARYRRRFRQSKLPQSEPPAVAGGLAASPRLAVEQQEVDLQPPATAGGSDRFDEVSATDGTTCGRDRVKKLERRLFKLPPPSGGGKVAASSAALAKTIKAKIR
jgi:hypothetical protein